MPTYTPTSIQVLTKNKVPTIDQAAPAVAPGGFEYSNGGQASMKPNITAAPVTTPAVATPVPTTPVPTTPGAATEQNFMGELDRIRQEALKIQGMLPGLKDTSTKKGFAMPGLETDYPSYEQLYPAVNEDQIYRKTLKGFQQQINATNQVYDQLLQEARLEGQGRLGTQRAAAARGGLIGSDFGMAQEDKVVATNSAERQALQAQRSAAIGAIMGTVRQTAVTEAENKRKAIKEGAESYISYLKSARERKLGNLTTVAKALIAQGIDPNTMTPDELKAIADEGGINPNDIITQYNIAKSEADAAAAEADLNTRKTEADIAKIEADIASGKLVTLGEGTMLYNTETGERIKNPKTYAPSTGAGTGSSGSTYSSDLDALVGAATLLIPSKFGQENFNKQIASARNAQDKLNIVASQVLRGQSADLRNDFTNLKTGVSQLDKAINLIDEGTRTGLLEAGAQYAFNAFGQDFDPKLAELRSNITAAVQPYRASITGAAWGTQEESEYQSLFGSNKYSPEELKLRLQTMREIMIDKQASALNSMVNPLDYYDNQFSSGYSANDNIGVEDLSSYSEEDLYRIANGG